MVCLSSWLNQAFVEEDGLYVFYAASHTSFHIRIQWNPETNELNQHRNNRHTFLCLHGVSWYNDSKPDILSACHGHADRFYELAVEGAEITVDTVAKTVTVGGEVWRCLVPVFC